MKNKDEKNIVIFENGVPTKPVWCKLLFLKVTFLIPGFKKFVIRMLKNCQNVDFTYGFRCFYGNIYGENCSLGDTFFLDYAPVYLGKNVAFSFDNMVITSTHDMNNFKKVIARPIYIGENTWITSRCTILGGVKIGSNSVIGAGSVVVNDIPSNCFAAGNPCKVIKYFDISTKENENTLS